MCQLLKEIPVIPSFVRNGSKSGLCLREIGKKAVPSRPEQAQVIMEGKRFTNAIIIKIIN